MTPETNITDGAAQTAPQTLRELLGIKRRSSNKSGRGDSVTHDWEQSDDAQEAGRLCLIAVKQGRPTQPLLPPPDALPPLL